MPTYHHACLYCKAKIEIDYSMKYVDNEDEMPQLIKDQVSCNVNTCFKKKPLLEPGMWPRIPYALHLFGMQGGTSVPEGQLLKEKQKQRSTRSRAHFKNEVLPKIKDPGERRHFEKKYKNTKKVDHEKM
jgi:hypothetical protein